MCHDLRQLRTQARPHSRGIQYHDLLTVQPILFVSTNRSAYLAIFHSSFSPFCLFLATVQPTVLSMFTTNHIAFYLSVSAVTVNQLANHFCSPFNAIRTCRHIVLLFYRSCLPPDLITFHWQTTPRIRCPGTMSEPGTMNYPNMPSVYSTN